MASIISAGTTSGTALNMAGDTSGVLQLATNGSTTALTIDASQNVGIGTSSPTNKLTVNGGIDFSGSSFSGSGTGIWQYSTNVLGFVTAGSTRAVIDATGNVGIGTTSPVAKLHVYTGSATDTTTIIENSLGALKLNKYSDGSTSIETTGAYNQRFFTNSSERWRIDGTTGGLSSRSTYATGVFPLVLGVTGGLPVDRGINVSNSAGSAIPFIAFTSSTTQAGYILTSGSTIAFVQGSDYRLKENVVAMDKSETLSKLMQVKPVNFDWKDGNKLHNYGFLAHELQETFPQAVHGEKDAVNEDGTIKTQSVNLAALIPYLVASIQEQQTIINDLKARITALEGAA